MKFACQSMIVLATLVGALAFILESPVVGQQPAAPSPAIGQQRNSGLSGIPSNFNPGSLLNSTAPIDPETEKLLAEEGRLDEEVRGLVGEYARTQDEGKRTTIKGKLSPLLDKQFDLQQKRRDLELAQLEAQLKKVRDLMKKRADARQTIVEKRLDQILRDVEGLGWAQPGSGGMLQRGVMPLMTPGQ
jgi:hypothetical protein